MTGCDRCIVEPAQGCYAGKHRACSKYPLYHADHSDLSMTANYAAMT